MKLIWNQIFYIVEIELINENNWNKEKIEMKVVMLWKRLTKVHFLQSFVLFSAFEWTIFNQSNQKTSKESKKSTEKY